MKKMLALLLALLLALSVSACAENLPQIEIPPIPEVTATPKPQMQMGENESTGTNLIPEAPLPTAEEAPEPDEEIPARILVTNGKTELNDYDPAEGEELILSFSYDMPRVYVEHAPEVSTRINEALATVEETFYTGDMYEGDGHYMGYSAMLEAAEDNFSYVHDNNASGMPLEYSDTLTARVTRASNTVLSVIYTENCYLGGAHGSYGAEAYNFDMATGQQLSLDQLSEDEGFADFLVERMLSLAEEDEDGYYSERLVEDYLPEGGRAEAFRRLLRNGSWYLNSEGLVIFSDLEEFGPYAAGMVEFHIPYADLEGEMDAKWLFPGLRQGKGKLDVCELSELEGGDTEIVDSLILNQDGQELCIVANGRIYDVSVCSVYYVDRFYENAQFWYASSLSDCALQLKVTVPEGLPNLRISYTTADGVRHGKLLSQSGVDGAYMLVDDDIQAVG